jgi:uncharacterized protein (DUF1499 family)
MRRLIIEEPVSRAAVWAPRVAWFALAVTLIAVVLIRFQLVELLPGVAALAAGLFLALEAAGLALLAFVRIWREGRRGVGRALWGLVLALLILGYPSWFALRAVTRPQLTDVSTDVEDPPTFSRSRAALEARGGRVPPDMPPDVRRLQRQGYPQIAPLTLDLPADQVYELVRRAAQNRGWQVIESARPGGRIGLGRLEAVDRTFLLRLPDDITVRIRPRADGARIDVRSASRIGQHDLGQNAQRVQRFLEEVANLAIALSD